MTDTNITEQVSVALWEERVATERTRADLIQERADLMEARFNEHKLRADNAESDLLVIGEAVRQEAVDREFCSAYEDFVNRVNSRTHGSWLVERLESVTVRFTVTVSGSGNVAEMASFVDGVRSVLNGAFDDDELVDDIDVLLA